MAGNGGINWQVGVRVGRAKNEPAIGGLDEMDERADAQLAADVRTAAGGRRTSQPSKFGTTKCTRLYGST